MSSSVEKYFSCLSLVQIKRVNELAQQLVASGASIEDLYFIRFSGDISSNPDEVLELKKTNSPTPSTFKLEVLADTNLQNLLMITQSSKVVQVFTSQLRKERRREVRNAGMSAINEILSSRSSQEKRNVDSKLRNTLLEIKERYGT